MLIRVALVSGGIAVMLFSTAAFADVGGGPVEVSGDYHSGFVTTTVTSSGRSGSSHQVAASRSSSRCGWAPVFFSQRLPLPDVKGGVWWQLYCNGNGWTGVPVFVPTAPATGAPVVTPAVLAQQAVNTLRLPAPSADHNPSGDALTNLAVWWWVRQSQWHPLSQRTQAGAVWARVTVTPTSSTWDAGDGTAPLTCAGPGKPYDRSRPADEQSTDCAHTYTESSAGQPQTGPNPNDRYFLVRVTVRWRVTWVGAGGTSGSLPEISRTSTFPLRVDDRETVVTSGSG